MVRFIIAIALIAGLAACQAEEPPVVSLSSQNVNDTRVAKTLFDAVPTASLQASQPLGGYARGCQAGAEQLAETGPTWQAMRLSRNRNWAQPVALDFVRDLSRFAATQDGWKGLFIGDMSQPRGGPMLTGHSSHQSGLDIDVWMLPPERLDLSRQEREDISSISMRRSAGAFTNDRWTPQHEAIVRAAASDPRVARIFIFPGAKVAMCNSATGDRSWLNKVRPWWGHHYHFHVRLNCPDGAAGCTNQPPPPPGDGCADAQGWVDRILNPPAPDPNAPPPTPRPELTMANLPGQCLAVLNAN